MALCYANVSPKHWLILFGPEATEMDPETAGDVFYDYTRGAEVGGGLCSQSIARRVVEMKHFSLF
jgi:hypothetical protein